MPYELPYKEGRPRFGMMLHLYLPSGEFLQEHVAWRIMLVSEFCLHLKGGLHTRRYLNLPAVLASTQDELDSGPNFRYLLVWNDMVLPDISSFEELYQWYGMSVDEPNDVIIVKKELLSEDEEHVYPRASER